MSPDESTYGQPCASPESRPSVSRRDAGETHVVVAGAGIAGMAAATILALAGIRVTLCEAASEAGGKAKSIRLADGHPTEHSLRVYTDDYQTLLTLFSRIPTGDDMTVLDNLVGVSLVSASEGRVIGHPAAPVPLKRQRSIVARLVSRVLEPVQQLGRIAVLGPMLIAGLIKKGLTARDVIPYLFAHLRLLWICRDRLFAQLGDVSYADYVKLRRKSAAAQAFFAALPRIYVAARPNAEAATIALMVLKGLFRLKGSCPSALNDTKLPSVMMMNGPSSERMIDPWIKHLEELGVELHFGTQVRELEFGDNRVTALISADGRRFACDYAILAVPYLALRGLAGSDQGRRHLPQLVEEHAISLEASNGLQCFLRDIPETWPSFARPGIVTAHVESEWSLVSVLQGKGFWENVRLPEGTKYILSITWSDVDTPGQIFDRPVTECSPDQILRECLAQCGLESAHLVGWQIDRELAYLSETEYDAVASELPPHLASKPVGGMRMVNFSPLTILLPGARRRSPTLSTDVPNLYLAGEAVYSPDLTEFLPTMEKAASSGCLAAHRIVDAVAAQLAPTVQIDFRDTAPFAVLRRLDQWLWNRRRPSVLPAEGPREHAPRAAHVGS